MVLSLLCSCVRPRASRDFIVALACLFYSIFFFLLSERQTQIISDCDKLQWDTSRVARREVLLKEDSSPLSLNEPFSSQQSTGCWGIFTVFCLVFGKYSIITLWYICVQIKISCLIKPCKRQTLELQYGLLTAEVYIPRSNARGLTCFFSCVQPRIYWDSRWAALDPEHKGEATHQQSLRTNEELQGDRAGVEFEKSGKENLNGGGPAVDQQGEQLHRPPFRRSDIPFLSPSLFEQCAKPHCSFVSFYQSATGLSPFPHKISMKAWSQSPPTIQLSSADTTTNCPSRCYSIRHLWSVPFLWAANSINSPFEALREELEVAHQEAPPSWHFH